MARSKHVASSLRYDDRLANLGHLERDNLGERLLDGRDESVVGAEDTALLLRDTVKRPRG
jgi:hypothetical protein